ncbi:hypothetical protein XM38_039010 [Halomicronema hongdechloris C2206]|uniref:Uncharacterized protein n=1 Tax=Halomicronema hongdechloris C2206 TaxID=1641165 RepID=A0A1Z3HRJ5_9CYAN|nr:hypothetical protein [Halomicronema hongdechloris]ASC72941.1 hypothetical protein XM38_039010 [Halomicronema hongdechloris C2206]
MRYSTFVHAVMTTALMVLSLNDHSPPHAFETPEPIANVAIAGEKPVEEYTIALTGFPPQ